MDTSSTIPPDPDKRREAAEDAAKQLGRLVERAVDVGAMGGTWDDLAREALKKVPRTSYTYYRD